MDNINKSQNLNEEFKLTEEQKKEYSELSEEYKEEYINYLKWIRTFYPVDEFEILGENDKPIKFYRFNAINSFDEKEKEHLIYFVKEENPETKKLEIVATIWVYPIEKRFNFLVEIDRRFKGYETTIYKNVQSILEKLGIEDRKDYYITYANRENHEFLQHMKTEELIGRTILEANEENAKKLLDDFGKYPYMLDLNDVNCIIRYAKKAGISNEDIVNALNENGCEINPQTIQGHELRNFKEFKLLGLKATSMHRIIMRKQSFKPLELISDIDKKDFTSEFQKIFEDLRAFAKEQKAENMYVPTTLDKFGEVGHIILNFKEQSLMISHLDDDVKQLVKKAAITTLDDLDKSRTLAEDYKVMKVLKVLSSSMTLDKDDYINIAMKMLNRNYTLEEYHDFVEKNSYFNRAVIKEAKSEMTHNLYFPNPRTDWETDNHKDRKHRVKRIILPKSYNSKKGYIRNVIKGVVGRNNLLTNMKIKTDMKGISRVDNKPFVVDNFRDWLFGVPGATGNLRFSKDKNAILLPPQTPQEGVEILKEVIYTRFPTGPSSSGR